MRSKVFGLLRAHPATETVRHVARVAQLLRVDGCPVVHVQHALEADEAGERLTPAAWEWF